MSNSSEYQDPGYDAALGRRFLISDMHDAYMDNIDNVAVGTLQGVGMVALLRGRVEPIVIDGEVFDERMLITLINFRLSRNGSDVVNIRCSDDQATYGNTLPLRPSEAILAKLDEHDASEDEWLRSRLARTQFKGDWAELSLAMLTRNPLLLGVVAIGTTPA